MDREVGHLPFSVKDEIASLKWVKIVTVGNPGVGKTCIIKHFCEDRFTPSYQATVGVDYGFKIQAVGEVEVRVHLWDMSGHSDYSEVRSELYVDSQACLLVYDVTNKASFDNLDYWLKEITHFTTEPVDIVIVANKVDVKTKKAIPKEEGAKWAQSRNLRFFETSSLSGHGIQSLFQEVLKTVLQRYDT
ncbi:DnaJ-like subfamily C member 27 [Holothuria leucospilota]|uniref:DnaJ-like subfamily C member 27 n=1 Tax=Holothuria leucospilota TaxID=206669 RepID=A0A9Q0YCR8_HOLLE|nr:DnaJ-like subfamily C member 27 [Holothuria leucospilota]